VVKPLSDQDIFFFIVEYFNQITSFTTGTTVSIGNFCPTIGEKKRWTLFYWESDQISAIKWPKISPE
jgi:hypothetical protein